MFATSRRAKRLWLLSALLCPSVAFYGCGQRGEIGRAHV